MDKSVLLTTILTTAGERLGAELIVNGDMETGDPPTGWGAWVDAPVVSSVTDGQPGAVGTKALDIAASAGQTTATVNYDITPALTAGKTYRQSFWYKNVDSSNIVINLYRSDYGDVVEIGSLKNQTEWTNETVDFVCPFAGGHLIILVYATVGQHARLNDYSIKEVL